MSDELRFALVVSTAGSVMNQTLGNDRFRRRVHSVIADRQSAAIEKARSHGIATELMLGDDNNRFCEQLLEYLTTHGIDYVFSFYTKFYTPELRAAYQDRIINFHPSLLPAFKGMDGFGDTVGYHARFAGNTVEFIDQVMDEGKIIMQTACPVDTNVPLEVIRHRVFVQQCQALLQVMQWLIEDRIKVDGRRVDIVDAIFDDPEFSPSLDSAAARCLHVPIPQGLEITAVTG